MNWFNIWGFIFMAVIMLPNLVYAIKCKDGFENKWKNRLVETAEQIGRFGCFEVNRALYMNQATAERKAGYAKVKADIGGLLELLLLSMEHSTDS